MGKIFLGYLFVFFHIKLNGFDILADCVGYFFIWQGLCAYEVPRFVQARSWALALFVINIFGIFGGVSRLFSAPFLSTAASLIATGLSLYLLWLIAHGVGELAAQHELPLPAQELARVWKVQLGASVAAAIFSHLASEGLGAGVWLALLAGLVGFAANMLYLIHLYKSKKLLGTAQMQ